VRTVTEVALIKCKDATSPKSLSCVRTFVYHERKETEHRGLPETIETSDSRHESQADDGADRPSD
jgi:hypothetical protein